MKELIEIDEILGKYFANEPIAENERMALIAFKNANKAEFDTLNNVMIQTETSETKNFNTEAAWNRIETQLTNATSQHTKTLKLRNIFSIARRYCCLLVLEHLHIITLLILKKEHSQTILQQRIS